MTFNLRTIPSYLLQGPARVRQVLAEQGPAAASRSARYYSMALCVTALAVYLLFACALGFFQISINTGAGAANLQNPAVLVAFLIVGLVDAGAIAAATWAAALAIIALFKPEEPKQAAFNALLWGAALAILYTGVFGGLLGYGG